MNFELLCLSHLMFNADYMKKVLPYLDASYFHDPAERKVFELIKDFVYKYKAAPTREALAIMVGDSAMPEMVFEQVGAIVNGLQPDQSTLQWMVDKSEEFAKDKAVYNAMMESLAIIDGSNTKMDKNAIPSILTRALAVSFNSTVGHSYFAQAEKQWEYYHSEDNRIAFDIDILNRVTKGGIKKNTLNIVFGGINAGKTTFLIHQAAHWLSMGKNVMYFTLEVDEEVIRERCDVRLMDLNFDQLYALEKQPYLNRINKLREATKGELFVKRFGAGSAHTGHFRHVLEELKIKEGFVPDLIIVDYLTICASCKLPPSAKSNTNTYFTSVAEELRDFACEFGVPLWTGAQFDRDGQTSENVDMTNTGAAIGIQATSDFSIAFMVPEELAPMKQAIGKILKSRYSNKSAIRKFMIGLDNDLQKYYDIDPGEQSKVMDANEQALYTGQSVPKPGAGNNVKDWVFN